MRKKPESIEEWSKNKPQFVVAFALGLVLSADFFYEIFKDYHNFLAERNVINVPPIKQWLKHYRNHKLLESMIKNLFSSLFNSNSILSTLILNLFKQFINEYNFSFKAFIDEIPQLSRKDKELIVLNFDELNSESIDDFEESELISEIRSLIQNPEILFIIRVSAPCWLFYGEHPTKLYQDAQNGELNSLCNLLSIDRSIVHDKQIAETIHRASMNINSKEFRKIANAFRNTKKITSAKKFKINFAVFISNIFSIFGFNLKAPEIQNLFDIAYQLSHKEQTIDPDLPLAPETFYMNLKRKASFWKILPNPNKK